LLTRITSEEKIVKKLVSSLVVLLASSSALADLTHHYTWDVDGTDVSGFGNNGTFLGNAATGSGQVGAGHMALAQGTTGSGYQGAFRLPTATSAPTPDMTWAVWIRIARIPPGVGATGGPESFVMGYSTDGLNVPNLQLRINGGSGVWQLGQWDGSTYSANNSGAAGNLINTGWRHVAATKASSGVTRLYIDGTVVRQFTVTNTLPGTLQSVVAGALENGPGNFIGPFENGMDDLRIYNTVLGDADIAELAQSPLNVSWNVDASGTWNTGSNWDTSAAPNVARASAILGGAITANRTVTLDGPVVVGSLVQKRASGTGNYTVALGGAARLEASSLGVATGTLTLSDTARSAVKTKSVAIASGAVLSLDGASIVVDYNGSASPLPRLVAQVLAGQLTTTRQAVGIAEASLLGLTSFGGVTGIDASSVLVRGTLNGDANLDGTVNFPDLLLLAASYNLTGPTSTWARGDFNYDGSVNFSDLLSLAANYNQTVTGSFEGDWNLALASVPEPTATLAVAGATLVALRRRRATQTI
jgi:hypothetical protein